MRSWWNRASALLPIATAALAAAVFIAEAVTPMKLTVAVFYVIVVLFAAGFCSARHRPGRCRVRGSHNIGLLLIDIR
jgi:hypothetical protein